MEILVHKTLFYKKNKIISHLFSKGKVAMDVVFIILNWNKAQLTIQAVKSVELTENCNFAIIVIDNGSEKDERVQLIKFAEENEWKILNEGDNFEGFYDRILLLTNDNYGYAKGNNLGLKLASSLNFTWAIVMNNDVILEKPVTSTLLKLSSLDKRIALIGPKIIGIDGKKQGPFRKPGLLDRVFCPLFYPVCYPIKKIMEYLKLKRDISRPYNKIIYPYRLMGCFLLLNLNALEEVGWFDENTFLYGEELILSEKLINHGYRIAYTEEVYVKHIHEATTSQLGEKRALMQLNSELYYFEKYRGYGRIRLLLIKFGFFYSYLFLVPILELFKKALKFIFRRK